MHGSDREEPTPLAKGLPLSHPPPDAEDSEIDAADSRSGRPGFVSRASPQLPGSFRTHWRQLGHGKRIPWRSVRSNGKLRVKGGCAEGEGQAVSPENSRSAQATCCLANNCLRKPGLAPIPRYGSFQPFLAGRFPNPRADAPSKPLFARKPPCHRARGDAAAARRNRGASS